MATQLKFYPKLNLWKNTTGSLTFNPVTMEAHSYRWWKFFAVINGKKVFNNYTYSVTTTSHQSRVRSLLSQLGIEIDIFVECPKGLDELSSGIDFYSRSIQYAQEKLQKPRIRQTTKEDLRVHIANMRKSVKVLETLGKAA